MEPHLYAFWDPDLVSMDLLAIDEGLPICPL